MRFIIVTDRPLKENRRSTNYARKIAELKTLPGVIDVIDKQLIQEERDDQWNYIRSLINRR